MNVGKASVQTIALQVLRWMIGWHFFYEGVWKLLQPKGWSCLSYIDNAQGPLADLFKWIASQSALVAVGDWAVPLGLAAIGLSLITGVLARVAAPFGILLMLMFYSAQPPEPFATAFSGMDGRFFVIERNILEALALLLIAVTPCWRGFFRTLLPGAVIFAVFSGLVWNQYRTQGFEKVEAVTSATVKVHEFTALKTLRAPLTNRVDLAGVAISPLALGGDLMAGHAHARDLIWTDEFMTRYHRGGSLERLVRYCSLCGINAAFVEPSFCATVRKTAATVGGDMKVFANCTCPEDAAIAVRAGAAGLYLRPERTDELVESGETNAIASLVAEFRKTGLPTGIGAEDLATVKACVRADVRPDFWVLAFHSLDYPAATMKTRCNSRWCDDPVAAADFMKTLPQPWVAFRCMAAGAIDPAKACKFARRHGATAAAIDLLDYRVVDTVNGLNPTNRVEVKK